MALTHEAADRDALDETLRRIDAVAAEFARARPERMRRQHLDPADFARLREAGFLDAALPPEFGGLWRGPRASVRPVCTMLRSIARGDPSVALVAAMHPAMMLFWLAFDEVPEPHAAAWRAQRAFVFETARAGHWWGTITSEPGSGGDILKTQARAEKSGGDGHYRLSGDKHFGSGSGVTSFMVTTAVPAGERMPDLFFMDLHETPWDGSRGVRLVAEWDGYGMAATQSHAFRFETCPATRLAWPGNIQRFLPTSGPFGLCAFASVVVGVVDSAIAEARGRLAPKQKEMRAFEQTEWVRARTEAWLVEQALEGMLRAVEEAPAPLAAASRGKMAIAELAETLLLRLGRVIGGGSFSRRSPFGQWSQDVRALGFLRPPWALAFDTLFALSFEQ